MTMGKNDLLTFIKRKAEVQKKEIFEMAVMFTEEAEKQEIPNLIESLSKSIEEKQKKLNQYDEQRKQLNLEISGLETAQAAMQQKVKRRKTQLHESELEVKTLREKLVEIQKRITPELLVNLNKVLDKLGNDKNNLHTMLTAFVSLINMKSNVTLSEVRDDVKSHSHLLEKLINGIASNFEANEEIVERQRETLKDIQKAFTDSTQADNKFCQPYAAILAWAQNFPFFLRHNQQLQKVNADLVKA